MRTEFVYLILFTFRFLMNSRIDSYVYLQEHLTNLLLYLRSARKDEDYGRLSSDFDFTNGYKQKYWE